VPNAGQNFRIKKVLIVDDDPDVVQTLVNVLEKLGGYQTGIAMDGKEALDSVKRSAPDLIILDLNLPFICGEEICKEIRKNERTKDLPVIMLTGKCRDCDRIVGRVVGADYYMTKPFDIAQLLETIEKIFRQ